MEDEKEEEDDVVCGLDDRTSSPLVHPPSPMPRFLLLLAVLALLVPITIFGDGNDDVKEEEEEEEEEEANFFSINSAFSISPPTDKPPRGPGPCVGGLPLRLLLFAGTGDAMGGRRKVRKGEGSGGERCGEKRRGRRGGRETGSRTVGASVCRCR